ncbi:phytoene desaturase family protein, partial [bacterium]|nr:phytoene desaturase family protein [bacterium]
IGFIRIGDSKRRERDGRRSMQSVKKEVIVVGAGPGGLATAILLASTGVKVRVIERLPMVGGRTSSIEAKGFKFDLGPTFFLYPQVLKDIFSAVGADLEKEVEMVKLDPQYRIQFGGGGRIDATARIAEMEAQISRISPVDAPGFRRFMDENRTKFSKMLPCLESPFRGWKDLLNRRVLSLLPTIRPGQSIDRHLEGFFTDPRIRLAFSFQSKYLGMSPFRCPSLFSILSFLEYEYGVFHPIGGCGALTKALAKIARRCGVTIQLNEPVKRLLFAGKRAVGVETEHGVYRADGVVVNADFARAMERMVPDNLRRRWTNKKISKKKFSCSTFMMYLGVKGHYAAPHHTIHISQDYQRNLDEIENQHVLSEDPSIYVQNASVTDSALAPKNHSTLYVLAPVTHQHSNVNWQREKSRFRETVLAQMKRAGFDGVEERSVFERVITPADWDNKYEIHRGATFNLAHSLDQMLHLRPQNRFEDLERTYLVGGGGPIQVAVCLLFFNRH